MLNVNSSVSVGVSAEARNRFPNAVIHGLVVDLSNRSDGLDAALANAKTSANRTLTRIDIATLAQHPIISAWRGAYRSMGLKPAKYRSSVEQLMRRAANGALDRIGIPLADVYNQVSIAHLAPMGAYDVDRLKEHPISLRLCDSEKDQFDPIGGSPDKFPLTKDIAVYAQGTHVLCWAINHRDAQSTSLTTSTSRALILSEGIDELTAENAEGAIKAMHELLHEQGFQCRTLVSR